MSDPLDLLAAAEAEAAALLGDAPAEPALTLAEVKANLRIDTVAEDGLIAGLIAAAEAWVLGFTDLVLLPLGEDGEVLADLKQAMHLLVAYWYRNRDSADAPPSGVKALCRRYQVLKV